MLVGLIRAPARVEHPKLSGTRPKLRASLTIHELGAAGSRLIGEEVERDPGWLQSTLGPPPEQPRLRDRWQRTAA